MKNFFALLRMTLVRKLNPLKVIGFAFRKDKGTFISGAKENNSCARGCELDGREIGGNPFLHGCICAIIGITIFKLLVKFSLL